MKFLIVIYFFVPAIVYLWPFDNMESFSTYKYFAPNYLYYSAPILLWFLVCYIVKPTQGLRHAGYIGGLAPLIYYAILFECCSDNSNALGWLYLWPTTIISMAFLLISVFLWRKLVRKKT